MASQNSLTGIEVTLRHVEPEAAVRAYVLERLEQPIRQMPNLRVASVEVTFEHTRPVEHHYVVQVTLAANGTQLRVEEYGTNPHEAVDKARDTLARRMDDWKGRVYFRRRREASARKESERDEITRERPEEWSGVIVRRKSHEIKPLTPEEAVEQMELLGHDFYFFLNSESEQYNVLYRRKAGGYGLIEPALEGLGKGTQRTP